MDQEITEAVGAIASECPDGSGVRQRYRNGESSSALRREVPALDFVF